MNKFFKNKEVVFVYSDSDMVYRSSAASARMLNYARALSKTRLVIFFSYEFRTDVDLDSLVKIENNIYSIGSLNENKHRFTYFFTLFRFILNMDKIAFEMNKCNQVKSFIFYPNTNVLIDFYSVLYLIKIKKYKIFYETNEVRKYSTVFMDKPAKLMHKVLLRWFKIKYIFSERLSRYFTGLICISKNIQKYFYRFNPNSILIPILANVEENVYNHKKRSSHHELFKIGFFGYVNYNKENLDILIESLNIFTKKNTGIKFEMNLYGPIDSFTEVKLKDKIKELKLCQKVFYKNKIEQKLVQKYLRGCDLLVLSRGYNLQNHYGFSTKLGEYLASGVPSLITDVSDNSLFIKDNVNGFIVPPDDVVSFAEKLEYIYFNYDKYYSSISMNSQKTVREHFNYNNYSKLLTDFVN